MGPTGGRVDHGSEAGHVRGRRAGRSAGDSTGFVYPPAGRPLPPGGRPGFPRRLPAKVRIVAANPVLAARRERIEHDRVLERLDLVRNIPCDQHALARADLALLVTEG